MSGRRAPLIHRLTNTKPHEAPTTDATPQPMADRSHCAPCTTLENRKRIAYLRVSPEPSDVFASELMNF
jgi:hypothetical protein